MSFFFTALNGTNNGNIFVGDFDIGVKGAKMPEKEYLTPLKEWVFKHIKTGKIENEVRTVREYVKEYAYTDFNAKYEHMAKRGRLCEYTPALAITALPVLPAVCMATTVTKYTVTFKGIHIPMWTPKFTVSTRGVLLSMAVAIVAAPVCAAIAYATLPREKLSVYRLRTEARAHMEDESDASDCLEMCQVRELKGKDGEDIITGSRLTKTATKTGRPKRRPYAAKVAQVARSKVGYLKNTPENRLIYQRVLIEIMDKDCVRYVDRDVILPLAIGCCFVYPDGVEESSALWGSQESLGVK